MVLEWLMKLQCSYMQFLFLSNSFLFVCFISANTKGDLRSPLTVLIRTNRLSNVCFINNVWIHCPNYRPLKRTLQPSTNLYSKIINRYNVPSNRSNLQNIFNGFDISNLTNKRSTRLHSNFSQPLSYNIGSVESYKAASPQLNIQAVHALPKNQKLNIGRRNGGRLKPMGNQTLHPKYPSTAIRTANQDGSTSFNITDKLTLYQPKPEKNEVQTTSEKTTSALPQQKTKSIPKKKFIDSLQHFEHKFYQVRRRSLDSLFPRAETLKISQMKRNNYHVVFVNNWYQQVMEPYLSAGYPYPGITQRLIEFERNSHVVRHGLVRNRQIIAVVFEKLVAISPEARQENGISFVQSGLFLHLALMSLYSEVDAKSKSEIEACVGLDLMNVDLQTTIRNVLSYLPLSSNDLKFRWSTHLVVRPGLDIDTELQNGTASAMRLQINKLNGSMTPDTLSTTLNQMVEEDSGGAMHSTFEEEEFSQGICSVLLTTIYMRPRWRSALTVLNGTRPFHNTEGATSGSIKMIRINDVMRYVDLYEWDAEALQIQYATPNLSLILVIPRGRSLRNLAHRMSTISLQRITDAMHTIRVAASIPLYTLRMTLLLPNKLEAMGLSNLITSDENLSECGQLKLSHAVQRLMFWSEAGRNAFKDDGIEWDETPELEIVVDRPYLFYVRWNNMTLMNGNFVL